MWKTSLFCQSAVLYFSFIFIEYILNMFLNVHPLFSEPSYFPTYFTINRISKSIPTSKGYGILRMKCRKSVIMKG